MTDDYAARRAHLRGLLHFLPAEWLDVAFSVAAADVLPVGDLDVYSHTIEEVVTTVLNDHYHLHTLPCSRTVQ